MYSKNKNSKQKRKLYKKSRKQRGASKITFSGGSRKKSRKQRGGLSIAHQTAGSRDIEPAQYEVGDFVRFVKEGMSIRSGHVVAFWRTMDGKPQYMVTTPTSIEEVSENEIYHHARAFSAASAAAA